MNSEVEKDKNGMLEDIDLALRANNMGGTEFRQEYCRCDPSVGECPCPYCAIDSTLRRAKRFVESVISGQITKERDELRNKLESVTKQRDLLRAIKPISVCKDYLCQSGIMQCNKCKKESEAGPERNSITIPLYKLQNTIKLLELEQDELCKIIGLLREENAQLREALLGLYGHTKNNFCICGLNEIAKKVLSGTNNAICKHGDENNDKCDECMNEDYERARGSNE